MMTRTAKIVYQDKRTLQNHEIVFQGVLDKKHAMKIAKKLRPKYHKIVSVSISFAVDIPRDLHESTS